MAATAAAHQVAEVAEDQAAEVGALQVGEAATEAVQGEAWVDLDILGLAGQEVLDRQAVVDPREAEAGEGDRSLPSLLE